ncbi:MAG: hypothetical protein KME46_33755 [Brasilonema angustatum HA4187-MV1]|nr:hypothetical protein [Brasilonema angustatum HA4187-MV1]
MLTSAFSHFHTFGFSGSRHLPASSSALSSAALAVPIGAQVFVGCARGVDEFFRSQFPGARVFSVASGQFGLGRAAFARRSVAFVLALLAADGVLVSFPSSPCPAGLVPSSSSSRCFAGFGSGSWSTLAFCVGLGLPCFVFLGSLPCPVGWGLVSLSGAPGWFQFSPALVAPAPVQLSLF